GIGTAFTIAYKKSETFRNVIDGVIEKVKSIIDWLVKFKDGIIGLFKDEGDAGVKLLKSIGLSDGTVQKMFDASGKILEVFHKIKGGVTGVIDMFKGDWTGGRSMLELVGFSPDQILFIENFVLKIQFMKHQIVETVTDMYEKIKGGFKGVIDMFTGDWASGKSILESVGFTPEQILFLENFVLKMQFLMHNIKQVITAVFEEVSTFVKGIFEDFKVWWDADGANIINSIVTFITDGISVVKDVLAIVLDVVVNLIQITMPIITGIIQALFDTIVNIFNIFLPIIH